MLSFVWITDMTSGFRFSFFFFSFYHHPPLPPQNAQFWPTAARQLQSIFFSLPYFSFMPFKALFYHKRSILFNLQSFFQIKWKRCALHRACHLHRSSLISSMFLSSEVCCGLSLQQMHWHISWMLVILVSSFNKQPNTHHADRYMYQLLPFL